LVDAFVLNMWLCALARVNHDTPEAGRLSALSHSVYAALDATRHSSRDGRFRPEADMARVLITPE
jgi:hypothetical protein